MGRYAFDSERGLMLPKERRIEPLRGRELASMVGPALFSPARLPRGFVSATGNGIGAVSDGNLVLVVLLSSSGTSPSAPTGWTRFYNANESNGYTLALYRSIFASSNAVVNLTNFPCALGYMFSVVYRGPTTAAQVGTHADSATSSVIAPALSSTTSSSGFLIGWCSTRDPSNTLFSSESMTNRFAHQSAFFSASVWEQSGAQSGTRTYTRSVTPFYNFTGLLFEIS